MKITVLLFLKRSFHGVHGHPSITGRREIGQARTHFPDGARWRNRLYACDQTEKVALDIYLRRTT